MFSIPESDDELLAECEVETFRSGGKGGQHANSTDSAVRLTHRPSGVVVTSQNERSQHQNKAACLEELRRRLARLNHRPKPRRPTKPTLGSKRRTREAKQQTALKKRTRGKPRADD